MSEKNPGSTMSRRAKKKGKKLDVKMEVFCETSDQMAPVIGYFPSGYDALTPGDEPAVDLYRNKKKPNRLELVVRPPNSNVEFVGKSYAGEAAMPQFVTYALGVLDKEAQTLKILPIAANRILRMDPRIINASGKPSEDSDEEVTDEKEQHNMTDLANIYGTKKSKNMVNKWTSMRQKLDDPTTLEPFEVGSDDDLKAGASQDFNEPLVRNIPPYDSSAVTPEKAYPLHKIIRKEERACLTDILETLESRPEAVQDLQFWENNYYPSFVIHRLQKLKNMKDKAEKTQFACILSYVTHLINFWKVAGASRWKSDPKYTKAVSKYGIPPVVFHKFMTNFLDPSSNVLSSEKNELVICYILVLTLFADNFMTDTADIEKDLAMTSTALRPYFLQLGCKSVVVDKMKKSHMTLPVPLVFQELKKRSRRR